MRARAWSSLALVALAGVAGADPKPKPVDITPFRDRLIVLQDPDGGIYVAKPGKDAQVFYGAAGGKTRNLYAQFMQGRSGSSTAGTWSLSMWSPNVPNYQPGSVDRLADGTYRRWCGGDRFTPLTELPASKAKAILDKSNFLTPALVRRSYLLARDDSGIYYYVDVIRDEYGGKGHRVFVGKKGAMKQRPLTDISTDTAGDVFATKTGDLRIVHDTTSDKPEITWVKGAKRVRLFRLDPHANVTLIYKELGVYTFLGTVCENL